MPAEVALRQETVNGRAAWVLDNGVVRVALLRGGGHIAEVRLISDDPKKSINPMRVPHYPTIDPHTYDPAKHDAIYGNSASKLLMSGYMGHLLCFPSYGQPSEAEAKAGLGGHGEAPIVEWKMMRQERRNGALIVYYGADLVKTQYRVERAVTLGDGNRHARVEEWVENLASYDRPFQWMQHATFGPPFVEPGETFMDLSGTEGLVPRDGSLQSGSKVVWPRGVSAEGQPVNLRAFQKKANSGTYYVMLMDQSRKQQFFTMYHARYRALIGYVFPTEGNPWLADWQENHRNGGLPWDRKVVARGIEWGNTPVDEGLRKAVERKSLFGVPSYGWIGAKERRKTEFTVFVEEIPEGFAGVKDVHLQAGRPVLVPASR
ncbi:MAG: hypothetical protein U0Q16_17790 [Bryobacteraceae bacterium]